MVDCASQPNVTATMLTGLGIDQYFARTDSNGTMSYLTDMLGSTIALANSSGTITTQYTYDPFGATTASGSSTNPFQFTGRENDGTGLYYYRARYYSPSYQRFVSQDPLGFMAGPNLYAYAWDDPSNLIDATGRGPFSGAIIGAFVGGETAFMDSGGSLSATAAGAFGGGVAGGLVGFFDPTDVAAGAAAGALGGLIGNAIGQGILMHHNPCRPFELGPFIGSGLGGAAVGAITGAIPENADNALLAKAMTQATLGPLGPSLGLALVGGPPSGR